LGGGYFSETKSILLIFTGGNRAVQLWHGTAHSHVPFVPSHFFRSVKLTPLRCQQVTSHLLYPITPKHIQIIFWRHFNLFWLPTSSEKIYAQSIQKTTKTYRMQLQIIQPYQL
jgi:hypothetical protein